MKKVDAEKLIPYIKTTFIAAFPTAKEIVEETPFVLIPNRGRTEARQRAMDACGATYKVDGDNRGEVIFGPKGRAVLIYTTVAETDWDFCHTGWHELGHVFTNLVNKELFIDAENDVRAERDTKRRTGMSVWSEFIAEYIAILIENEEPQPVAWPKQDILSGLIKDAVGTGMLNPYPLAFYCAMMMGDNTIDEMLQRQPDASIGLDECDDLLSNMIVTLLRLLDKQLCKEDFWDISLEELEGIGAQVDEIWTHCYYSGAVNALQKIIKRN